MIMPTRQMTIEKVCQIRGPLVQKGASSERGMVFCFYGLVNSVCVCRFVVGMGGGRCSSRRLRGVGGAGWVIEMDVGLMLGK